MEITEEYDRRGDEPDNSTHVKNTILFTDLDKFEISRYKDFTYDNGVMPDSDEGYTTVTSQDMLDEINGYMDKSRKKSGISISVTDNVGNTKRLNGLLFEFTFGDRNVPVEHLEENEKMPLYGKSIEEASELGERDKYFANMKENKRCEDAIVTAIADNYRNSRLDTDGVLSDVLKEFVFERSSLLLRQDYPIFPLTDELINPTLNGQTMYFQVFPKARERSYVRIRTLTLTPDL